jgi:hypothetical protein
VAKKALRLADEVPIPVRIKNGQNLTSKNGFIRPS